MHYPLYSCIFFDASQSTQWLECVKFTEFHRNHRNSELSEMSSQISCRIESHLLKSLRMRAAAVSAYHGCLLCVLWLKMIPDLKSKRSVLQLDVELILDQTCRSSTSVSLSLWSEICITQYFDEFLYTLHIIVMETNFPFLPLHLISSLKKKVKWDSHPLRRICVRLWFGKSTCETVRPFDTLEEIIIDALVQISFSALPLTRRSGCLEKVPDALW